MRTAKYTWQDHKTSEDILSELKINTVVKKIQNYRNEWVQHVWQLDGDRLPHLIMKYHSSRKQPKADSSKDCSWDCKRSSPENQQAI